MTTTAPASGKADLFAKIVLSLDALAFGAFGALYLIRPEEMAASVGIALKDRGALVDVQGMYGGLELGLALYLVYCLLGSTRRGFGLLAGACALTGIAATRALAVARFGLPGPAVFQLLIIDWVGAILNLAGCILYARRVASSSQ